MTDIDRRDVLEGGSAHAVAVSTSSQLAARGLDLAVNAAVALLILRHLGPGSYGDYVLVVTIAGLTALLAELGLPKLAVMMPGDWPL